MAGDRYNINPTFKDTIMKAFKILMLVAVALAANVLFAHAAKVEYTIGNGGTLSWNNSTGDDCGCPFNGGGCIIKVTVESTRIISAGDYWEVSGVATTGLFDITAPIIYQQAFNATNYLFAPGFFEVQEGQFPGVPGGTRINLGGTTTDATGFFRALVRKNGPAN
jgi:hypothetical protein